MSFYSSYSIAKSGPLKMNSFANKMHQEKLLWWPERGCWQTSKDRKERQGEKGDLNQASSRLCKVCGVISKFGRKAYEKGFPWWFKRNCWQISENKKEHKRESGKTWIKQMIEIHNMRRDLITNSSIKHQKKFPWRSVGNFRRISSGRDLWKMMK